ncbi:hypothetical protein FA15DRAFT_692180 [Coprinopsis marcescibilis]|uniref:Uncharacterized protein n=1 Tax=Coprinopsis marcescibilis TaxID=230819 RepID=A0A5C3L5J0_COPMA|nr:hypothetical protein FA15DRAFT_692180 [Coprinopsis marcescibilis]
MDGKPKFGPTATAKKKGRGSDHAPFSGKIQCPRSTVEWRVSNGECRMSREENRRRKEKRKEREREEGRAREAELGMWNEEKKQKHNSPCRPREAPGHASSSFVRRVLFILHIQQSAVLGPRSQLTPFQPSNKRPSTILNALHILTLHTTHPLARNSMPLEPKLQSTPLLLQVPPPLIRPAKQSADKPHHPKGSTPASMSLSSFYRTTVSTQSPARHRPTKRHRTTFLGGINLANSVGARPLTDPIQEAREGRRTITLHYTILMNMAQTTPQT